MLNQRRRRWTLELSLTAALAAACSDAVYEDAGRRRELPPGNDSASGETGGSPSDAGASSADDDD